MALSQVTWSVVTNRISSWSFEHQGEWLASMLGERKELHLGKGKQRQPVHTAQRSPEHRLSVFLSGHPEFWNPLVVYPLASFSED